MGKNESLFYTISMPCCSLKLIIKYQLEGMRENQDGSQGEQVKLSQKKCRNKVSKTPQARAISLNVATWNLHYRVVPGEGH